MKKNSTSLFLAVLLGLTGMGHARNWTLVTTPSQLRAWPTMALSCGMYPVFSNGMEVYVYGPYGMDQWWGMSGYLAGDGVGQIVFNSSPVKYGADGRFYSTAYPVPVWWSEAGEWLASGPGFPGGTPAWSVASADPSGWVYMISGNQLGMTRGSDWQVTTMPLAFGKAGDLTVSRFGDVAVSGYVLGSTAVLTVAWFDYKAGVWLSRSFGSVTQSRRVAVEFDALGNLGVAYVNSLNQLRYAYLDMGQDYWTDDLVADLGSQGPFPLGLGAALAYDAKNEPVIAAGQTLAFNPIASVSGTVVLGDYPPGPLGVTVSLEQRRMDRDDPVWTYSPALYSDGKFYVPNVVTVGTYDVAIKASHWLRVVVTGVAVGEGSVDVGTVQLVNGDCDGDNAVDSADLSVVLAAFGRVRDNPNYNPAADVNANGMVDGTDLGLLLAAMDSVTGEGAYNSRADLDANGSVDSTDLSVLMVAFGNARTNPDFDPAADLNGDTHITIADLSILLANMDQKGDP